jgi:outer membrane protein
LVSLRSNAEAQREALGLAQKLYQDNQRRVEIGTLAPIEIVRAEAEVAAREENLTIAETQVQQQETLLKNALSVTGMASPSLMSSRIIPTDEIEVPRMEDLGPIEDLMQQAITSRPDVEQSRIQLGNRDVNLKAIRNARLPQLTASVDFTNNGLAGQINDLFLPTPGQTVIPDEFFLGGLNQALGQVFARNFPDYQFGLNLSIPLRNRQAQADLTATMLERRQAEVRLRQSENGVRVEVQNAVIGVQQARARYQTALKSLELQERTLEAEQKKFDLGASTIFLVVQAQRDLALARSAEIAAMNNYVIAKIEIERATGTTLTANNISVAEAVAGVVSRAPSPLP